MSAAYQLNTVDSSINIHINSADAANFVGIGLDSGQANTSDMIVVLDDVISCDEEQTMALSIESIEIPITYYNVSSAIANNRFLFTENGVDTIITLQSQNYTVDDIIADVANLLNSASAFGSPYTIAFNSRTFKFSISSTNIASFSLDFGFSVLNSGNTYNFTNTANLLGFNFQLHTSSNQTLTAPRPANMNTVPFILLDTEFSSRGSVVTSSSGSSRSFSTGVLTKIPINKEFGDVLVHSSTSNRHTLLVQRKRLHTMRFRLKDPQYNGLDLNGVPFSLTLTVDFIDFSSAGVYDNDRDDNKIKMTREDVNEVLTRNQILSSREAQHNRDNRNKLINLLDLDEPV